MPQPIYSVFLRTFSPPFSWSQQPRPPTQPDLRSARVSDLGFVVSTLQAGEKCDLNKSPKQRLKQCHSLQPPFPRPPVRPNGWLRGLPQKKIPSSRTRDSRPWSLAQQRLTLLCSKFGTHTSGHRCDAVRVFRGPSDKCTIDAPTSKTVRREPP